MKLTKVKRVLTKRLGYLSAKLEKGWTPHVEEERDALETALRCLGMLEPERVERSTARVLEVIIPAQERTLNRARRGDRLREDVAKLVVALQRAARAA